MVDFEFTDEQAMIRNAARDFADKELAAGAAERDEKEQFPSEEIKKMAELGFMGMMVPEEAGGSRDGHG